MNGELDDEIAVTTTGTNLYFVWIMHTKFWLKVYKRPDNQNYSFSTLHIFPSSSKQHSQWHEGFKQGHYVSSL